jgi:hypothetical protein
VKKEKESINQFHPRPTQKRKRNFLEIALIVASLVIKSLILENLVVSVVLKVISKRIVLTKENSKINNNKKNLLKNKNHLFLRIVENAVI